MRARPEVIAALRKTAGKTLRDIAGPAGIDPATLLRIERGTSNGRPETLRSIADALGVTVETITDSFRAAA